MGGWETFMRFSYFSPLFSFFLILLFFFSPFKIHTCVKFIPRKKVSRHVIFTSFRFPLIIISRKWDSQENYFRKKEGCVGKQKRHYILWLLFLFKSWGGLEKSILFLFRTAFGYQNFWASYTNQPKLLYYLRVFCRNILFWDSSKNCVYRIQKMPAQKISKKPLRNSSKGRISGSISQLELF